MSTPPLWAQNNARRTFALVAFDREGVAQRVAGPARGGLTSRYFRRAALAVRDPRIVERRPDMLVGWRRTLVAEVDDSHCTSSITLTGFVPYWSPDRFGFHQRTLGVVIHQHAIARLFERAIQPLETVARELLSRSFGEVFSRADLEESDCGFAAPFRDGRFLGSLEQIQTPENSVESIFNIRSWLPKPLENFVWTEKASRTHRKAAEFDHLALLSVLLRGASDAEPRGIAQNTFGASQSSVDSARDPHARFSGMNPAVYRQLS